MQFKIQHSYNVLLKTLEITICGVTETLHMSYNQGSGLVAVNCNRNISIRNSKFNHNCEAVTSTYTGGNVILSYESTNEEETNIELTKSHLSHCHTDNSGGLSVII